MRRALIAAIIVTLFGSPAFAQVGAAGAPGIAATSPLGMAADSPAPPTGIPLGATELASPGISPAPAAMGMPVDGAPCSPVAAPTSGLSGQSTPYDGGGMAMGSSLPNYTAPTVACGAIASGGASRSAATTSTLPGGVVRAGIPLGSVEIDSGGVSPLLAVPVATPTPSTMGGVAPSMGAAAPCPATGSSMSSLGC
jgi:hypothetical protein